jgi:glycosyltransferase involved in cell wall biosynthesis
MATYNGARHLREQVDSILSQLLWNDELIISDDNSTDDTRSIVASYNDRRVKLITNPSTSGHVRNFANSIAHAKGRFVALSDQDDVWVEPRLERMLARLEGLPKYSLVVGDFIEFNQTSGLKPRTPLGTAPGNRVLQLHQIFSGKAKYFGCTFLFRYDLTRFILPIPSRVEAHDIWIAMNACVHGRVSHLEETTLLRRIHGQNLTPARRRSLLKICCSRANYCAALVQSSFR